MISGLRYAILAFLLTLFLYFSASNLPFSLIPIHLTSNNNGPSKVIVMGKLASQDTSWVSSDLPEYFLLASPQSSSPANHSHSWDSAIYTVDKAHPNPSTTSTLHTPLNKAREATPYLTYLLTHYDSLPDIILFLHAHRDGPTSWHVDFNDTTHSNVDAVRALRLPYVQEQGYVNLRCGPIPGCTGGIHPATTTADLNDNNSSNMTTPDPFPPQTTISLAIRDAWQYIFPSTPLPDDLAVACCAQFAVTREQVHARGRDVYERFFEWVRETELDDSVSGRAAEYLWHVLFGKENVHCPAQEICYCEVYGRC
ncbi:hypothetical protein MMC20_003573 [Loxospora ochrophaea]|nr:hypothetical protein [Loxospora ochrophaea]